MSERPTLIKWVGQRGWPIIINVWKLPIPNVRDYVSFRTPGEEPLINMQVERIEHRSISESGLGPLSTTTLSPDDKAQVQDCRGMAVITLRVPEGSPYDSRKLPSELDTKTGIRVGNTPEEPMIEPIRPVRAVMIDGQLVQIVDEVVDAYLYDGKLWPTSEAAQKQRVLDNHSASLRAALEMLIPEQAFNRLNGSSADVIRAINEIVDGIIEGVANPDDPHGQALTEAVIRVRRTLRWRAIRRPK